MNNPITNYLRRKKVAANRPANPEMMVNMTNITSMECYNYPDGGKRRVLDGCSMQVKRAQSWGISCDEPFEMQLLMEIMGNVKPYENGKCVLCEMGMMRNKRRVLEHLYYVNDQGLLYPHMQVLTWLMHATTHCPGTPAQRQLEWIELLLDADLDYLTLAYARRITDPEQLAIATLPALKMPLLRVVLIDLSQLDVPEKLYQPYARIVALLRAQDKAVVICSHQRDLLHACCDNAAFLIDGRLDYQGSIAELCSNYDSRRFIIHTDDVEGISACMRRAYPELRIEPLPDGIELHEQHSAAVPPLSELARAIEQAGLPTFAIEKSGPTLEQAFIGIQRLNRIAAEAAHKQYAAQEIVDESGAGLQREALDDDLDE